MARSPGLGIFPCRFDSTYTQDAERESQGRVKRTFSMGIWRGRSWILHLLVLMMDGSATRRVPFDTVSELSGTYRTLLVLVMLRWYSVIYTRVQDRELCDTFYIPESHGH